MYTSAALAAAAASVHAASRAALANGMRPPSGRSIRAAPADAREPVGLRNGEGIGAARRRAPRPRRRASRAAHRAAPRREDHDRDLRPLDVEDLRGAMGRLPGTAAFTTGYYPPHRA
jgi:hypothetical protein